MKTNICLALIVSLAFGVQAQELHNWNISFRVTDEAGQPIKGAEATVFYDRMALPNNAIDPGKITGLTDSNGTFMASHRDRTYGLRFRVEKDGYYTSDVDEDFHRVFSPERLNRNLNIALKKIGKPIAMHVKWVNENPPTLSQPVGYDLMIGDWVGTGHKGVNTDIIFQKEAYRNSGSDYEYKVKVTFPKSGDGIQIYTIPDSEKGSGLRSPHEAPLNGYQTELDKERSAHPGQPSKNDNDLNQIYLFRVRTAIDDRGNVVSAHYGKIYGDFMQFTYYLNPTPNDQNIEFDPKQNLIHDLQSFEQVTAP